MTRDRERECRVYTGRRRGGQEEIRGREKGKEGRKQEKRGNRGHRNQERRLTERHKGKKETVDREQEIERDPGGLRLFTRIHGLSWDSCIKCRSHELEGG